MALLGCLETKVKARRAGKIQKKLGAEWQVHCDYIGCPNGRIWVCWKPQLVEVDVQILGPQIVHYKVKDNGSQFALLCNICIWIQHHRRKERHLETIQQIETQDFQDCVDEVGLGQIRRKGWQYSWCNKRDPRNRIYSLIDWAFGNAQWFSMYSSIEAHYLNPGCSDHSPILLTTTIVRQKLSKSFRLLNVLLKQHSFKEVVESIWETNVDGYAIYGVCRKLKQIEQAVKQMNQEMNKLDQKIEALQAKVKETQEAMATDLYNAQLIIEEKEIVLEVEKWAIIQERVLRQKSRVVWISQERSTNAADLTKGDVQQALKELPNDKAPGVDGFNAEFFKEYWSVIGEEVSIVVLQFFEFGKMLKEANYTTLILVPKVTNPTYTKEYRLIA
ncbi:uncharacterized protein [Nicotiana sylvestris]|uniref:uncharacterized protein n=1 Tax=Nicotiana sylvestris TaxID=4096 RepID=UPI00388CC930